MSYYRILDREKQLSILYQKQGRTTQFANKAARDKWLQKEIADSERVMFNIGEQVLTSACCMVFELVEFYQKYGSACLLGQA